jgi:hypothetical protein
VRTPALTTCSKGPATGGGVSPGRWMADDQHRQSDVMYRDLFVRGCRRRHQRRGGAAVVLALAFAATLLTACGTSSKLDAASTTTAPVTMSPTIDATTTTTVPTVGQQAFAAYQHAFAVIAQIEGSPTGRSTDPRLKQILVKPWYSQIIQEINLYRLRSQVVRGPYSFSNFQLDDVTPDGRVIFTDCQTNGQALYNATTGSLVGNSGAARLPEQVVIYHPSANVWQVADDNAVTTGGAKICVG